MEDPNFGLRPVVSVNRFDNQVVVADQRRDIVVSDCTYGVPAMISEVIDYEVELVGQKRPEGVVEIDRQTVAVAKNESRAVRIAVTPQGDDGVIVHGNIHCGQRLGYVPYGVRARHWTAVFRTGFLV